MALHSPPTDPYPFEASLKSIRSQLPEGFHCPSIGIICGSGLSGLSESLIDKIEVPYDSIEGFTKSTVQGHKSALAFGYLKSADGPNVPVVAMLGRFHPYEGHSLSSTVYPVRVMALLGVKKLIITNAAGGLNPDFKVGTIVVVNDHLSLPGLTGLNPLLGALPPPPFDPRFVPLTNAYSLALRKTAFRAAARLKFPRDDIQEGVYAYVSGPTYESRTEGRMLRGLGASCVGMSTVGEVIAAVAAGLEVLVFSLITNPVITSEPRSARDEVDAELAGTPLPPAPVEEASHAEVLEVGRRKAEAVKSLVEEVVAMIGLEA